MTPLPDVFPQKYESLLPFSWLAHGFVPRVPDCPATVDRAAAMELLQPLHLQVINAMGYCSASFRTAEQVHGAHLAVVGAKSAACTSGVDGLLTNEPGLLLGIYVADCGPVYLVDPEKRALALVHSGKKGSESGIAGIAVRRMQEAFGSKPEDIIVQLGPCIRYPRYEVDFPAQIRKSCLEAGVPDSQFYDCLRCTWEGATDYYSYRREAGKTGRMLALLGIRTDVDSTGRAAGCTLPAS